MENQSNQSTSTYQNVITAIRNCNDIRTLKFALLDTIENMKATNLDELLTDLIDCYGLGKNIKQEEEYIQFLKKLNSSK